MSVPPVQTSADGERSLVTISGNSVEDLLVALEALPAKDWKLALCFGSAAEGLALVGKSLQVDFPDLKVAGCTSAGLVNREADFGSTMQVTLFGGVGFECEVATGSLADQSSREAGSSAASAVTQLTTHLENTVLFLLIDGLVGDANHVIRGAYETVGATVPIVGGCAGDDLAMVATHQLAGSGPTEPALVSHGVVGVALTSSGSFGIGVDHGWSPQGDPMTVTEVDGTSVLGLDDRAALDVYLEAIGLSDEDISSSALATICQTRPLGLQTQNGHHVRFIRGGNLETRSIEFLVAIPEGELATLMHGDACSVVKAAGEATEEALAQIPEPPLGIVAFDCVACRGVMGDDLLAREVEEVTHHLPSTASVAGLYTYGEIARRGGQLGFHNQTMVVLALQ